MTRLLLVCAALLSSTAVFAKHHDNAPPPPPPAAPMAAPATPKLIIAVSVDQFSADLFEEYRPSFTGGFKRLMDGAVFTNGYQAQAATETCPGHSTILTGTYPRRNGIIANNWIDLDTKRDDKGIYCSEDENVPGSTSKNYTVSAVHLKVPTLGDRLKTANPATRVVSVAGKDRAAVMMGGHNIDEAWWWTSRNNLYQFTSFDGKTAPAAVKDANAGLVAMIKAGYRYPALPDACRAKIHALDFGANTIGVERPAMPAGIDTASTNAAGAGLYTNTALDVATMTLGLRLINDMKLGQGTAPDVLAIGLSVTDPIGHAFGPEGPEMCAHIYALDAALGDFLTKLDATGVSYALVLTADHGGHDIPERPGAAPNVKRLDDSARPTKLEVDSYADLKIETRTYYGDSSDGAGNLYIAHDLPEATRAKAIDWARKRLGQSAFVEAVYGKDDFLNVPPLPADPTKWTIVQRVAASSDAQRSGDLYVVMKEGTQTISDPSGSVMAHGSVWDYDRRVPIIFYGKGIKTNAPKTPVATVDIMPTFAAMIGLPVAAADVDGHCLTEVAPCTK